MTEAIIAARYLLEKLNRETECHCDIFRHIYGMKPGTAERRLREWREAFNSTSHRVYAEFMGKTFSQEKKSKRTGRAPGYIAHRSAHSWTFTRPFIAFLKQQIKAAYRAEKQPKSDAYQRFKEMKKNGELK